MADVTYRSAYGKGLYGVEAYGVSGAFKEGEAIVIGVTTTAAANVRVRLTGAIAVSSSSNTSDAQRVREASATASVSTTGSCSAERVREVDATSSTSATTSAACERVREQSATVSATARIRLLQLECVKAMLRFWLLHLLRQTQLQL